ncbi:hypothetical protein ACLOJK_031391 [Asimina triloba]
MVVLMHFLEKRTSQKYSLSQPKSPGNVVLDAVYVHVLRNNDHDYFAEVLRPKQLIIVQIFCYCSFFNSPLTDPHLPPPTSAPPRVISKVYLAGAATESTFPVS